MPRLRFKVPKYRKHRASGQAIVTLGGIDHYLGPHGTKASKTLYDRLIAEYLASNRMPPGVTGQANGAQAAAQTTVVEIGNPASLQCLALRITLCLFDFNNSLCFTLFGRGHAHVRRSVNLVHRRFKLASGSITVTRALRMP